MSKPWAGAGAWAADAERAEAEEREHLAANPVVESSFPSLKDSVAAKPKKKNKGKTFTLSEFATGNSIGPGAASRRDFSIESKGLTHDEMYRLPTGPRERSVEEMEVGRLGGGFKNYGGGRSQGGPPMGRRGDDGGDGSWGGGGGGRRSYGGFDDDRRSERPPPRVSDFDMPSRADEVDNWAMGKKPLPRMDSGRDNRYGSVDSGRQDKYSSLGGGSRADEVDNWGTNKKSLPVRSTSNFGSGFRDPLAPEADRWTRTGPLPPHEFPPREVDTRERPRLVLDPPRGDGSLNEAAKSTRPSPFGVARPREDVLAEKGLDWKKLDSDIETKKTSRPTSSHSSRPSSAHSTGHPENPAPQVLEGVPKPRPKVNPFGDAKPREVLLQEKGMDWRKIDFELEHRSVDRPETVEEQMLKDEIDYLKKELEKEALVNANGESVQGSSGVQSGLRMEILNKEKELELLIRDLDDKVRFGQKATERPGSGGGRSIGFFERPGSGGGRSIGFSERPGSGGGRSIGFSERPGSGGGRSIGNTERPPSQSGRSEEYRNVEYIDRPQSRGTGDAWTRPVDDRRAFQGTRDRGFLSSREDRPRSRERW